MKRHLFKNLMFVLMTVLFCTFAFTACMRIPTPPSNPIKPVAYVAIDINPSVEMILDQNGKVLSVYGANTNAQIMLFDEGGIVGSNIDIAIENLFILAQFYGYLDESPKTVSTAVVSTDDSVTFSSVQKMILTAGQNRGANVTVVNADDADLALSEELRVRQANDDKYADISKSKYRLIKRAVSSDIYVTMKNAPAITTEDLLEWVQSEWSNADSKYGDEYAYSSLIAQYAYDVEYVYFRNNLYSQYIEEKYADTKDIPDDDTYETYVKTSSTMQFLDFAYMTINHIYSIWEKYTLNPYFNENHARSIYNILSPCVPDDFDTFIQKTSNTNDYPTLENINCYVNYIYRNSTSMEQENLKSVYSDILTLIAEPAEYFKTELIDLLSDSKQASETVYFKAYANFIHAFKSLFPNDGMDIINETMAHFIDALYEPSEPPYFLLDFAKEYPASPESKRDLLDLSYDETERIESTPEPEEIVLLKNEVTDKLAQKKQQIEQWISTAKMAETR